LSFRIGGVKRVVVQKFHAILQKNMAHHAIGLLLSGCSPAYVYETIIVGMRLYWEELRTPDS
jgi:hypothetical protein